MIITLIILGVFTMIILPFLISKLIVAKAKKQIESERQIK